MVGSVKLFSSLVSVTAGVEPSSSPFVVPSSVPSWPSVVSGFSEVAFGGEVDAEVGRVVEGSVAFSVTVEGGVVVCVTCSKRTSLCS